MISSTTSSRNDMTTLAELLPRAARHWPASGAVSTDGEWTGWVEIERLTAALAASLRNLGVRPGQRVAVLHPKSLISFQAMHGAIRAGAVAVPLDPLGSPMGTARILEETEPAAIIGAAETLRRLAGAHLSLRPTPLVVTGDTAVLESALFTPPLRMSTWDAATNGNGTGDGDTAIQPHDPAYVIFTSGSTGRPKGIVHTHAGALAYAAEAVTRHRLGPGSRLAGIPPLHFDMSTLELYAAPLAGATIVDINEAEIRFPATLSARIERDRVSHLYAVPFLLRQLQERGGLPERDLSGLIHIAYGGEPYPPGAVAELMALLPQAIVLNVYGPAEVNAVTTHELRSAPDPDREIPLGDRWLGVELRVVADDGSEAGPGVPGELWISAPTCMAGYWRQPELTASVLRPRPDGRPPWYRTGDIVVADTDGALRFLGRRDHQVKVRGVRLELEAIEAALTDAPGIEHAVAGLSTDPGGEVQLVAQVVLRPGATLDPRVLRRWCAARLPGPAVPSVVTAVDRFPTTATGKIDRRAVRASLDGDGGPIP